MPQRPHGTCSSRTYLSSCCVAIFQVSTKSSIRHKINELSVAWHKSDYEQNKKSHTHTQKTDADDERTAINTYLNMINLHENMFIGVCPLMQAQLTSTKWIESIRINGDCLKQTDGVVDGSGVAVKCIHPRHNQMESYNFLHVRLSFFPLVLLMCAVQATIFNQCNFSRWSRLHIFDLPDCMLSMLWITSDSRNWWKYFNLFFTSYQRRRRRQRQQHLIEIWIEYIYLCIQDEYVLNQCIKIDASMDDGSMCHLLTLRAASSIVLFRSCCRVFFSSCVRVHFTTQFIN